MYIKNKRGQSTVEYILLVTAVIAVMIVFATNKNGGFQTTLNSTYNTATSDMNSMADRLASSHAASPADNSANAGTPSYSVNVTP